MMNVTTKQLISLLLMTLTMAVILAMLPEHPADQDPTQTTTSLARQLTE